MKELKSAKMKSLLAKGVAKARKIKPPSEGSMCSLIYRTDPNGWHYQVEYIHDSRTYERPYVTVFAFAPPLRWCARSATHRLTQVL